jgi:diacylglycerol kinase family enzyme
MVSWIVKVANELARPVPRFGFLKLGTGNAMAWVLGTHYARGKGVVADLARLRSEGGSRSLRLIEIEGLLTPFAGLGADAITLEHQKNTRSMFERHRVLRHAATGPITYGVAIAGRSMPQFLLGAMPEVRVTSLGTATRRGQDGKAVGREVGPGEMLYQGPVRLLAMSTIPYWGFGARIFPYAEERADRFNLRIVNFGSLEAVAHLRQIWQGTYRSDRLYDFLVDAVRIECEKPTPLQIGGDVVGQRDLIEAKLSEQPVNVVDYYAPPPV